MRGTIMLCMLVIAHSINMHAQPVKLQALAGAGLSFTTKQQNNNYYVQATKYFPSLYYRASLALQIPLSERVEIETGLGYDRRSVRSIQAYSMSKDDSVINNARATHHYAVLPLQISAIAFRYKKKQLWISAGFNYGFLVSAKTCNSNEYFYKTKRINSQAQESCYNPSIVLLRDQSRLSKPQPNRQLYAFDVATLVQLSYTITNVVTIRAHYNYSLYNMDASGDGTTNQHNTGLSVLFRLL